MMNKSLANAIAGVLANPSYGLYDVQLKFIANDGSFTYSPIHIDALHLVQDFLGGYGDDLTVTFPIAMNDYNRLYKVYQNLTAQLIIKYLDMTGHPVPVAPMLVKKYYPVFANLRDPSKSVNDVTARNTVDLHITVSLVEPTLYKIRHIPIQGIFHNTTMAGAISHLAEGYKIDKTYIQTPDNTHKYDHLVIPPYREFRDLFHTLQERYGVYMLGLNNYYTQDCLYVYPPLDTDPVTAKEARILKADQGGFAGIASYHRTFDRGISIVANNDPLAQDHSLIASEHHGVSVQFLRAANQIDGVVSQDDNGLRTFNQDSVVNVRLNKSRLAQSDSNKTVYAHQTDNMFALSSELARHQYINVSVQWPQARPWAITPGQAVKYYSDESGKVGKRTGQVQSIIYEMVRGERTSINTYKCIALIKCRLSPNEQLSDVVS